jgi:hypothetical protein
MLWALVFGGIALAGLVMLVSYGVWLAHKAADVMSEVRMVGERVAELADLLAQVQIPAVAVADESRTSSATYDGQGVALVASEERES